jgi:hypothetical protein
VIGPARNSATADDEARWAEALRSLEQGPTPAVRARLRRIRLLTLAGVVVVALLALLVPLLLADRPHRAPSDDPTTALDVVALVVLGAAVLLELAGVVLLFRGMRGRWASPLVALTQRQNRELRSHVRGETVAPAERVPLARYLAESTLRQRPVLLVLLGGTLQWTGMALAMPAWWRTVTVVGAAVVVLLLWLRLRREERGARRFLDEHPATDA